MHKLVIIRLERETEVESLSDEQVQDIAESGADFLNDVGDENNWYEVLGVIDGVNGKIHAVSSSLGNWLTPEDKDPKSLAMGLVCSDARFWLGCKGEFPSPEVFSLEVMAGLLREAILNLVKEPLVVETNFYGEAVEKPWYRGWDMYRLSALSHLVSVIREDDGEFPFFRGAYVGCLYHYPAFCNANEPDDKKVVYVVADVHV